MDNLISQYRLGTALWIGVESANWSLSQFTQAAQFAYKHGIDTLLVKFFDGANGQGDEWYSSIGGFDKVKSTIENEGVKVLPYGYMYGDSKGSILDRELDLLEKYMNLYGWVAADIEAEWRGQTSWASRLNARLSSNSNLFYVSCFADPVEQTEQAVFQAMAPSVNVWMPQVYSDFLESVYTHEFPFSAPVLPTADLSNEFGPNNPALYEKLLTDPHGTSIWEYQTAVADPFLLDTLVHFIEGHSVLLTNTGEIMALNEADQFQPGKSQFECGYFACAMVRSAAPPGKTPIRTVQQVIDDGEMWYGQYDGDTSINNTAGMTLDQLYSLIRQMTYDYVPIDLGNDPLGFIRGWIRNGYPVIVAAMETSFHDMALGGAVPYPWSPAGSHIVVITGVTSDGNFLVRDSANVTDLYNPNTLRPGPRKYNASALIGGLVSATAVQTYWLPKPPAGYDPRKGNLVVTVPVGWKDDGTTLTAPNGKTVRTGFRTHVLNNPWDPGNVPLEEEVWCDPLEVGNPSLGAGSRQRFVKTVLGYTSKMGVYEQWTGQELMALSNLVAQLQQAASTGITPELQAAINQAAKDYQSIAATVATDISALQKFVK